MKLSIRFGVLLLALLTSSCWATKQVKQVSWKDHTFQLSVSSGGATTSFSWKVTARYPGFLGTREVELFQAYGGPFLTDIQVEGTTLVLLADYNRIELDLQHLDEFMQDPILYKRFTLTQNNPFYIEPDFIKTERGIERRRNLGNLEAEQHREELRRQQRKAGWN